MTYKNGIKEYALTGVMFGVPMGILFGLMHLSLLLGVITGFLCGFLFAFLIFLFVRYQEKKSDTSYLHMVMYTFWRFEKLS